MSDCERINYREKENAVVIVFNSRKQIFSCIKRLMCSLVGGIGMLGIPVRLNGKKSKKVS